jgi:hypothetical protein
MAQPDGEDTIKIDMKIGYAGFIWLRTGSSGELW